MCKRVFIVHIGSEYELHYNCMKLCYIILVTEPLGSAKSAGEPSGKNSFNFI